MKISIWFVFGLIFYLHLSFGLIPNSEWNALYDFYNSTSGGNWDWKYPYSIKGYPWDFSNEQSNDPCNSTRPWQGINCTTVCLKQICHIEIINLPRHNLNGTLPSSLENLHYLQDIRIDANGLYGEIPDIFNSWQLLRILNFDNNSFIGTFPNSISTIISLTSFSISFNHFIGTLPTFTSCIHLLEISIEGNMFSGNLPTSYQQLTSLLVFNARLNIHLNGSIEPLMYSPYLQYLQLSNNAFSGELPDLFQNIKQLKILEIASCQLYSPIPSSICELTKLIKLNLGIGQYYGTIPQCIGNLTSLEGLTLNFNLDLVGTIPSSISNLTKLTSFSLAFTSITGTIPESIGQLTDLIYLVLDNNLLTGSIPSSFVNLKKLRNLYLCFNQLSGSIPDIFYDFNYLTALYLFSNQFTGIIPSSIGYASQLQYIYLFDNILSQNIPDSLGSLQSLIILNLCDNRLTGTIPQTLNQLSNLSSLSLHTNLLIGSITYLFEHVHELIYLNMNNNQLSGSIPISIGTAINLLQINFAFNHFIGSLPSSFYHIEQLVYLDVSSNALSGIFPQTFIFNHIQFVSVANNVLTGPLPEYLGPTTLQVLYLSNNSFTGTIPSTLFISPSLVSIVASINCLSGTIPSSICYNQNLSQLVLDGSHSSSTCKRNILSFYSQSGYILRKGLKGTIPNCLFNMSNLQILHLSGNMLSGTIPEKHIHTSLNSSFYSLILANNILTGTLPASLLNSVQSMLDVSFNRITGKIGSVHSDVNNFPSLRNNSISISFHNKSIPQHQSINKNLTLNLNVNRLSGYISSSVLDLLTINILEGNMFNCHLSRDDLPTNDPRYDSFQCGSDYTNITIIIWVFLLVSMMLWYYCQRHQASGIIYLYQQTQSQYFTMYTQILTDQLPYIHNLQASYLIIGCQSIRDVHSLVYSIMLWILFVIAPTYMILSIWYSSQSQQYVWLVSSALLTGEVPAIILSMLYLVLIIIIVYQIWLSRSKIYLPKSFRKQLQPQKEETNHVKEHKETEENKEKQINTIGFLFSCNQQEIKKYCISFLVILFIVIIVLMANILFILSMYKGYNPILTNIISLSMSLFKVCWNNVVILGPIREMVEDKYQFRFSPVTIILLSIFNYIVSPYIAETFVSPDCLAYAINQPPSVTTKYYDFQCYSYSVFFVEGIEYTQFTCPYKADLLNPSLIYTSQYIPPFHYTFQCSPSLLSTFSFVFIYRYIVLSILEPFFFCYGKHLQLYYLLQEKNKRFQWISMFLPHLFGIVLPSELTLLSLHDKPSHETMINSLKNIDTNTNNIQENNQILSDNLKNINSLKPIEEEINNKSHEKTSFIPLKEQLIIELLEKFEQSLRRLDGRYGERLAIRSVTDIFLLFSFGVLFPPLAIIIFFSLFKDSLLFQYSLGRLIYALDDPQNNCYEISTRLLSINNLLNHEFHRIPHVLWIGIWFSSIIAVIFWSISLNDILSQYMSLIARILLILIMIIAPYLLRAIITMFHQEIHQVGDSLIELKRLSSRILSFSSSNNDLNNVLPSIPSQSSLSLSENSSTIIIIDNPLQENTIN